MNSDFAPSLNHLLGSEGGWSNDPKDRGGPTMEGVTQKEYDMWRVAHRQPVQSVRNISPQEVQAIYGAWYWQPILADQLPAGVDYCVFDCAVNSGPHQATKFLQRAVSANDDGLMGPATLAAVLNVAPADIVTRFSGEHLSFLMSLPGWAHDGRGWGARVAAVKATALAMIGS